MSFVARRSIALAAVSLGLALAACKGEKTAVPAGAGAAAAPAAPAADSAAAPTAAPQAGDSLVAERGGVQIWFTLAREARDSAGQRCLERGVELRRDGHRTPVPLFYTTEAPRFVNDTVAEAHLSMDCRPGPLYGINLRTGQPIPPKQLESVKAR